AHQAAEGSGAPRHPCRWSGRTSPSRARWSARLRRRAMKWVTRRSARVNRIATAWLVRRFIDEQPIFLFVEPEQVAAVQNEQRAIGFDAPGARYPHRDERGRCSFEALVD